METLTKQQQLEIYTKAGATEQEWIELRVQLEIRDALEDVATRLENMYNAYQRNH